MVRGAGWDQSSFDRLDIGMDEVYLSRGFGAMLDSKGAKQVYECNSTSSACAYTYIYAVVL